MDPIFSRDTDTALADIGSASSLGPRLTVELKILKENADVQSYFRYESSGLEELGRFCIYGYLLPRTEPYNNGAYKVRIILPSEFPDKPPEMQLLTYIYHPAVHEDISKPTFCCLCCSPEFRSGFRINDFIKHYVNIIDRPDLFYKTCDYHFAARRLYDQDRTRYNERALEMVERHSCSRPINQ